MADVVPDPEQLVGKTIERALLVESGLDVGLVLVFTDGSIAAIGSDDPHNFGWSYTEGGS